MLIRTYLIVGLLTLAHSVLWCGVALLKKRNDLADVAWGLGFLLAAAASYAAGGVAADRGLLVTGLTALWALRLSYHIHSRNRGKGEDYRYLAWRQAWGEWFYVRTFLQVFVLQWLLMLMVALPVIVVNVHRGGEATPFDVIGSGVWLFGFYFEAVGDRQLLEFTRDPSKRGQLLTTGLWRYSRHPNYFGEVAQWWGLALISLSVPQGWLGLLGAASITLLILKVSGIPLLEERMAQKPGYGEYADKTPAFIPWFVSRRRS
jgi:steroid 5-alpha reductase family enzyme